MGSHIDEDPMERVRALERWVHRGALHPLVVGAHYFRPRDQPLMRWPDGEAVLRGFVNTADAPHFELVQANRRLWYNLYTTRSTGRIPSRWADQPIRGMVGVGTWRTQAEFRRLHVTSGDGVLFADESLASLDGWRTTGGS